MTFKEIQGTTLRPVEVSSSRRRSNAGETEEAAAGEKVTTTAHAEVEAAVRQARDAAAGARTAELESIEAAVRNGTYRPDPARIAQRILEDAELTARLHALIQK